MRKAAESNPVTHLDRSTIAPFLTLVPRYLVGVKAESERSQDPNSKGVTSYLVRQSGERE